MFLLIGMSVALWLALLALGAPRAAIRAALALVIIELAQGLIGFVQYFTHLPVLLVGAHMLGATLVWTGTLAVLWSLRARPLSVPGARGPADASPLAPAPAAEDASAAAPFPSSPSSTVQAPADSATPAAR